ncbi:MAG TPA: methyltransferase [Mogibacterium sp.]|nr:methyltransferase [Mogibacterium sp.]
MTRELKDGERIDNIGFGGIKLIQHKEFGYGIDSVLLASFAAGETGARGIQKGSFIADLGTGSGVVAFIISHKVSESVLMGIDIREDEIDRATRSGIMNNLDSRVRFIAKDINEFNELMERSFDAVVSNPPYFRKDASIPSKPESRHIARHETTAGVHDFAAAASGMLDNKGSMYLVHRPERLVDIFDALRKADLEPKEMQMVLPYAGKAANIVLIHAIKGGGPELRILPDIIVRKENGEYTEEITGLYER